MARRQSIRALVVGAFLVTMWGCGSSAGSSQPAAAVQPSQAAASEPPPSAAPPAAPEASTTEPSFAIPSFVLPSGAKDLEAILPNELCGSTAVKFSMSADQFMTGADEEFVSTLEALGKQPSDVTFAAASSTDGGCSAGIFRIKGVDEGKLRDTFLAEEQKTGTTYTQASVGGKSVYVSASGDGNQYAYIKGDAVIFVVAKDEASAATILQALP